MAIDPSTVDLGAKIDVQTVIDGLRQIQVAVGQVGNKLDETTQKSKKHFKETEDGAAGLGRALSGVGSELKGIATGLLSLGAAKQLFSAIMADAERLGKAGIESRQKLTEVALARGGGAATAEAIGAAASQISATTHMPQLAALVLIDTVGKSMPRLDQTQKMLAVSASVARIVENRDANAQQEIARMAGILMDANPSLSPDAAAALAYSMHRASGASEQLFGSRGLAQVVASTPAAFEPIVGAAIAGGRAKIRGGGVPFLEGILDKAATEKKKIEGGAEVFKAPGLKGILEKQGLGAGIEALMAGTQPVEALGLTEAEKNNLAAIRRFYAPAIAEARAAITRPGSVYADIAAATAAGQGPAVSRIEEAERVIRVAEAPYKQWQAQQIANATMSQAWAIQKIGSPMAGRAIYGAERFSQFVDSGMRAAGNLIESIPVVGPLVRSMNPTVQPQTVDVNVNVNVRQPEGSEVDVTSGI